MQATIKQIRTALKQLQRNASTLYTVWSSKRKNDLRTLTLISCVVKSDAELSCDIARLKALLDEQGLTAEMKVITSVKGCNGCDTYNTIRVHCAK